MTWEKQRRNVSMSSSLGAILFEVVYEDFPAFLRYIFSLTRTVNIVIRERPDVLVVQNPSILLSFFVVLIHITRIFNFKLVVDAHNAGIFPPSIGKNTLLKLRNFILKNTDITIVTNENLAKVVKDFGGRPIVIEDPMPVFSGNIAKRKLKGKINFLFICSYADDEPYFELINAARQLDKDFHIYMTGAPNREIIAIIDDLPGNLTITGYLPENEYDSLLFSVDAVIDLTNREDCLVCGAYEALSAFKPLILSEKRALVEYFGTKGIVYTKNNASDIARCIKDIFVNLEKYRLEVYQIKLQFLSSWQKRKEEFFIMLDE